MTGVSHKADGANDRQAQRSTAQHQRCCKLIPENAVRSAPVRRNDQPDKQGPPRTNGQLLSGERVKCQQLDSGFRPSRAWQVSQGQGGHRNVPGTNRGRRVNARAAAETRQPEAESHNRD